MWKLKTFDPDSLKVIMWRYGKAAEGEPPTVTLCHSFDTKAEMDAFIVDLVWPEERKARIEAQMQLEALQERIRTMMP